LPHNEHDWFALLPAEEELAAIHRETGLSLWDFWNEWEPAGFNEDGRDEFHPILGWPAGGLDENYGFDPPAGCSDDVADYGLRTRALLPQPGHKSQRAGWRTV
jgi:hypothetical protein